MDLKALRLSSSSLTSLVLILFILISTGAIIYYAQSTLGEIEDALPVQLAQQESDVITLVTGVNDLKHGIRLARAQLPDADIQGLRAQLEVIHAQLQQIREKYSFRDLIGVSSIHALFNPMLYDVQKWLTDGVYNLAPGSDAVLRIAELRVSDALREARSLSAEASNTSFRILSAQASRMRRFRTVATAMLGAMTLLSLALIYFVLHQQRTMLALRDSEEQIRYRANHDLLTGLPNRASFIEHLEEAVGISRRRNSQIALLFIDLDRFKTINDTLGHAVGDQLIREVGERIRQCVRATDVVARLGGDEFTVLLQDASDVLQVSLIARNIIDQIAWPFQLEGHEVFTSASIGVTVCPGDSSDTTTLLKNADMAMYQAKEKGRNTFRFFTSRMTQRAEEFLSIDKDLRRALEQGELSIEYQPIFRLADRQLVGVEALLRWNHPERGLIAPDTFIPVAEETGLILDLGYWVLSEACLQMSRWHTHQPLYLSVNVSMRQFMGGFGPNQMRWILEESALPADRLVLEITESLLMEDSSKVHGALQDLHRMGIRLAVDDFGTGYSALKYLRDFPVDTLKIDRSFVQNLNGGNGGVSLVETIIAMARGMDLVVVAEGVEDAHQEEVLRRLGCEMVQGFYYSRPLTPGALETLLREQLAS
ncbi:MAG TPA: EAL domain-containing protein [Sedimenticola thiotaurini]|uniref:cyclic-guanylate-specific phosphodiesterase n=1 Tax=Sedimenticola thiotaurini TaxID=1543721 RepID=A0A831RLL2_9GAMM|nr:EAL domain-containing protein [Sedimenticola thiotaurini]